ncbi:MAG: hypothetical protein KGN79_06645 [Acidobacteriota bacterium]|nr:hypothetical protein [Acidobacteriota bacterium]
MTVNGERLIIPDPLLKPNQKTIQFSFKHLDTTHNKFLPQDCTLDFWRALAHRLKGYSQLPLEVFLDQNNPDRRHVIDFGETTEPNGFASLDTEQLAFEEAWQFDLGTFTPWRIAGLLVDEMFYIVWLDHSHRLYI